MQMSADKDSERLWGQVKNVINDKFITTDIHSYKLCLISMVWMNNV